MLGDDDETQLAASHQYLTAGLKKIFPKYADLANKSGHLLISFQFLAISDRDAEPWLIALERTTGNQFLRRMGLKALRYSAQAPAGPFFFPPEWNSAPGLAERLLGGLTLIAILFTLKFMQQFAQPLAGPVQLRLRDAFRTSQHLRDLVMLIPLDIMQDKYGARARWQLRDAAAEIDSINRPLQ